MSKFREIDFDVFLDVFERANAEGTRIRATDTGSVHEFYRVNGVDEAEVMTCLFSRPGLKMTNVNFPRDRGIYVYTWNDTDPDDNIAFKYG